MVSRPVNWNSENIVCLNSEIMLKQAQNNKIRKMTKYSVGRDSDESRFGKGKQKRKVGPNRIGYLWDPDRDKYRVSIRNY